VDEELSRRSKRRASTRHRHALHNVNWFIVVAYTSSRAQLHRAFAMRGHGYESAVVRLAHTIIHESRSRGCFYRTRATTSFPYFTYGPPFASCASFDASFTCQLSLSRSLSLFLSLSFSGGDTRVSPSGAVRLNGSRFSRESVIANITWEYPREQGATV